MPIVLVGLPQIRTSVDHGTAFDIAGTGVADPTPMLAALREAVRVCANRTTRRADRQETSEPAIIGRPR